MSRLDDRRASARPAWVDAVFRPQWLLLGALGLFAVIAAPQLLKSREDLRADARYALRPDSLTLSERPRWVPEGLAAALVDQLSADGPRSILDDELLIDLAAVAESQPWIKGVVRIEKRFPDAIVMQVEYREPAALVETTAGPVPIDAEGYLLPLADLSLTDRAALPRIGLSREHASDNATAPAFRSPSPTLSRWEDSRVLAAARIIQQTRERWDELELTGVEALPVPQGASSVTDLQFALRAAGGTRVLWGRAVDSDWPGELTTEQKLERVAQYVRNFGQFSTSIAYDVDIRHWNQLSRVPATNRH